ncbi:hypothetical protein ACFQE8_04035 [Salinirubellus sp. GCM10025818]|uniref:hypothetical protein n=1 Tax=Salinirubellus TaxID=2162630 RepID=UPI0030D24D2D
MNALLAIKPEFAEKILAGSKRYEFRRTAFRSSAEIEFVYLYASSPVKKIVGLFTSERIVEGPPEELWELFGDESGIETRERFLQYFEGVDIGYAIEISESHRIHPPLDPQEIFDEFSPPMSFNYLQEGQAEALRKHIPEPLWEQTVPTELTRYESD